MKLNKQPVLNYTMGRICSILGAEFVGDDQLKDLEVQKVLTDSRKVKGNEEGIFCALAGERNDGHKYLHEAWLLGIRAFLISHREHIDPTHKDGAWIIVEDTTAALQQLAMYHRNQYDIPTIGITGSNGKTITKEWLYQLIGPDLNVVKSPKSYNSQIGVPLSVLNMGEEHHLGIFEAGISRLDEMEHLAGIIDPAVVILTNIGPAHDAGFDTREQKLQEKLKIAVNAASIIYCKDQPIVADIMNQDERAVSWGKDEDAHFPISTKRIGNHTLITLESGENSLEFRVPFSDRASLENVCHCLVTLMVLDFDVPTIQKRVLELKNVPMRMEMKYGANSCTIIDDTYSADLDSLKIALEFLDEQPSLKLRTLILSEFRDTSLKDSEFISEIISLAQAYNIKKLVGVGTVFKTFCDELSTKGFEFRAYDSTDSLLEHSGYDSFNNQLILIKGAREFRFERVVKRLQLQSHRTVLEINLSHLVNNLNLYKKFVKDETGVVAMVKAFSYGAGSVEIASVLEKQGVAALAVAYTDEGVKLRKAGVRCPVMVMNAADDDLSLLLDYQLEPEVYSLSQLRELKGRFDTGGFGENMLGIHLKLETGMHRLGVRESSVEEALELISSCPNIHINSIFSHLAAAEDASFDSFTFEQLQLFKKLSGEIMSAFDYEIKRHILNSAGIIRFTGSQYDWVRLGIGMYGIDTTSSIQERLEPVGTLKTRITQIKEVKKGETVGYGRKGEALNDMKIAVLPVGYADGFDRRFSNGKGETFIKGKKARIIGNICMDLSMIDVSYIDNPQPGDEVEIFGKNISIVDAAARIGTIPYELLTNISERVKRVYIKD
ncbi:MAG: bifunctional UDP-N-acetylmuramoyl-tripeptide:D-alanyl-D-alanine ligase/alanine racemase [Bacteroidetes bacterium]|nr:bifunctional UDP-N-acetylmuramoyl-tripeptide:D-alanyl-D-alanine ligase/alanine racemase [Bacteroidota bacterium]